MSLIPAFVMPSPYDVSVTYLTSMLGQPVMNGLMGEGLPGSGTIFSHMMDTFNHLLLGGGLIIFAILLVVGTMNTAAEGQFLGRQWHSVWTPMRLIFGILLVVPLKTGYCIGQYIILYAILIGVHFATVLWQSTIVDIFDNQSTPPAPTYLNDEIKQVVGEEYLALAVPVIANIISPSSGSGTIQPIIIPVNNTTAAGSSGISSGMVQALQNFAAQPTSLCPNLFAGLNGGNGGPNGNSQSLCLSALATALLNAQNVGSQFSLGGYNFFVNIGSPASVPATQMTLGPLGLSSLDTGWSSPSPDGLVQVYGAYVYAPPSSTPSPKGGSSGGGSGSGGSGSGSGGSPTPPPPPVTNPVAVKDLTTIVNNTLPANLPMNAQFSDFCNQTMVTYNGDSISACDVAPVVQDILTFAQANAQKLLLSEIPNSGWVQGAAGSAGNQPSQFSPTPISGGGSGPGGNTPYNVPPNGQAAANANNMFVYYVQQGGLVFPRVGYNLNDYWIPDINSQSYIDLQLNNSWWWAGSSYLVLDNVMAQNLSMVAQNIQQQLQAFSGSLNPSGSNSNVSYQCNGAANFKPDTTDVTNVLTPEFCLTTGIQITEYSTDVAGVAVPSDGSVFYSKANPNDVNNSITVPLSAACEPYLTNPTTPGASSAVTYFTCVWDKLRTSTPVVVDIPYSSPDAAVSNWANLIMPFDPRSTGTVIHVDTTNTPALYAQLSAMPANLQGPFAVLFVLANNSSTPAKVAAAYNTLYPYIAQLVQVLQFDGLLSGNQVESMLPVNKALSGIFSQLVGGGTGVGSASDAQMQAASINTVMQQVYNLGITNTQFGVVANQFSLIQQAQNVGINMILACITSMEDIYTQYSTTLEGMATQISNQAAGTASSASAYIYGGLVPVIGPLLQAVGQNKIAEEQLNIMSTTLITLTNISIQLMWLPLLMFILTSLFTAGVQFAILVPLMPYILFWAGQIAWLIGVLEAVVAAPLVMLGLAHPGGHEYLGHAQPAVRMLLGVMFRPVLMVIGMIVGILLTYIVIAFSAQGFHTVAAGILNAVPSSDNTVQGTLSCLMLFIYATFLVMAFQKCFSTIYIIPERVVEWIGGQAMKAGEGELQQMQSATQSTAQSAGQAGQSSLQQGLQAQESKGQKMSDLSSQKMSTAGQVAGNMAKGGAETEAQAAKIAMTVMG